MAVIRLLVTLSVFLGLSPLIGAQEYQSYINWQQKRFVIHTSLAVTDGLAAKTKYLLEQTIEDNLSRIFFESAVNIVVDSFHTIGDIVDSDALMRQQLQSLYALGRKDISYYSADFKFLHVVYSYPVFGENGIIRSFFNHQKPYPLKRYLGFTVTDNFSGLVIYAKGMYKVYGKDTSTQVTPALFLRLFDESMNLVLVKEMCLPEYLTQWGMAEYMDGDDLAAYSSRIGSHPLKIMARGIFGKYNTDIIIPSFRARQLLASLANRTMLQQARILIMIDKK